MMLSVLPRPVFPSFKKLACRYPTPAEPNWLIDSWFVKLRVLLQQDKNQLSPLVPFATGL